MQLLIVNNIFSGKLVQALCWMLLHSLWLGLALTIVTGTIILTTKKQTAALRYNLLSTALLLFTLAITVIFIMQLTASELVFNNSGTVTTAIVPADSTETIYAFSNNTNGFTGNVINFFNEHAAWVVCCWLIIIVFRCIQFAGGLYKIKQIKTTQLTPVNEYWRERITCLAAALNIRSKVQLVQSGIAKMPMVVGHFKPVILFPLGLLTALPAAEVEAVLLHELAHIRRKDYLVNLLQHCTEIVFFFNPAVLWVSALIKSERENCCDDIAVAQAGSKRNYINALVSFQEYHLHTMQYATALGSDKNQLLQRVKRMLYNNNKTLNTMEKTFLAVCFVATTSLAVFFTTPTTAQTSGADTIQLNIDTTISIADKHYDPADFAEGSATSYSEKIKGVTHTLVIYKRNGKLYEVYGDITSLKIDGKIIPQSDWGKYKKLVDELRAGHKSDLTSGNDNKELTEKLKAEELALLGQQDKLNAELQMLQLQSGDKQKLEELQLLAQKNNLNADMQKLQLKGADKKQLESLQLLAQKNNLNADMQKLQLHSTDKKKMEELQLQAQKNMLNEDMQSLQLQSADKLKAEQLMLQLSQDKLSVGQLQLSLEDAKAKALEYNKANLLQLQKAATFNKAQQLKLEAEKKQLKQVDIQKQKAELREQQNEQKLKQAEEKLKQAEIKNNEEEKRAAKDEVKDVNDEKENTVESRSENKNDD
ncbi:M56 family metallopeptidase [Ferruginibacter sp. SUN106]|uniref:M56 family metallopeptidase n=1 Tax=Ferruginibacter sp. SUN106 TaxID=2978348 RepID=UPI003D36CDD2